MEVQCCIRKREMKGLSRVAHTAGMRNFRHLQSSLGHAQRYFATSSEKKSLGEIFTTLIMKLIFVFNSYKVKPSRRNWRKTKKLIGLIFGRLNSPTLIRVRSPPPSCYFPSLLFLLNPTHSENTATEKLYGRFSISFQPPSSLLLIRH
jgi:hypothetical protein